MADLLGNAAALALLAIEATMEAAAALGGGTGTRATADVPTLGGGSLALPVAVDQVAEVIPTSALVVKINSLPIPQSELDAIVEVSVKEDVEAPSMFTLRFSGDDGLDLTNEARYNLGGSVELTLADNVHASSVFKGEITGLEIELTEEGLPSLVVRGYDRRHRLLRSTRTKTYAGKSDGQIAKEIASIYNLRFGGEDTTPTYEQVLQHAQTDLDFLRQRAARIGYEVMVDGETLYFRPHKVSTRGDVTLSLEDLTAFYARMSAANQPNEVHVRGWDPQKKDVIDGVAAPASDMGGTAGAYVAASAFNGQRPTASTLTLVNQPVFTAPEAQRMAKGQLQELLLGFIRGEGTCNGRTDLRAGTMVALTGLGARFNGAYYVLCVERTCASGSLSTKFTVQRSATRVIV